MLQSLRAIVHSAANLCRGELITLETLPRGFPRRKRCNRMELQNQTVPILPLVEIEKEHICKTFYVTGGNLIRTAALLGICLNTLRSKLRLYEMI